MLKTNKKTKKKTVQYEPTAKEVSFVHLHIKIFSIDFKLEPPCAA